MRPYHAQVFLRSWPTLLSLSPVPILDEVHYLQVCRVLVSGQFIQTYYSAIRVTSVSWFAWNISGFSTGGPAFQEAPSPRQPRMVGHLIIYHALI